MSKTESEDPNVVTHKFVSAPGQAVNILEARDSSDNLLFAVDKDGSAIGSKINNEFAVGTNSIYTTIQAGVDAAEAAGGGIVILLNGTHILSAPVIISKKTITIRGSGTDTVVSYIPITGAAFDCSGITDPDIPDRVGPRFESFRLTGPGHAAGATTGLSFVHTPPDCDARCVVSGLAITEFCYGIKAYEHYVGIVENCYIGENDYGFYGQAANEWTLMANEFQHNHIAGIYLTNPASNPQAGFAVTGGAIENNYGTGVVLESRVTTATFTSVDFEINGLDDPSHFDVSMFTTDGFVPNNIAFIGCNFFSGTTVSIDIAAAYQTNFYACYLGGNDDCVNSIDAHNGTLTALGCCFVKPATNLGLGSLVNDYMGGFIQDVCLENEIPISWRTTVAHGNGLETHQLSVDAADDMQIYNQYGNFVMNQVEAGKSIVLKTQNVARVTIAPTVVTIPMALNVQDGSIQVPHRFQETQPALMTGNGQLFVWKDDVTRNKTWLMTQMGGQDYKIQMTQGEVKNLLSADFAIDGVATVTVTTAHGLAVTPAKEDIAVSVVESTAVDDWTYGFVKVVSVDADNIVCKVRVTAASATGGAKAKLGFKIDMR